MRTRPSPLGYPQTTQVSQRSSSGVAVLGQQTTRSLLGQAQSTRQLLLLLRNLTRREGAAKALDLIVQNVVGDDGNSP